MMKGFQLGSYILEEKLGQGGMAEVWKARNPVLNTYAAVKFLVPGLAGNPDIERRFLGEGKRQAALQHPNIVSAFDFHYVDNRSYLVMRYIDGESLEHRLFKLQAPMPLAEATAVSRDVLSALGYAHSEGVVHRDIKPSNLLIENGGRVHILDFGIALVLGEERLTRVGAAVGTPHYMSPEQIVGARTIDGRSDIYSFGCVLYQALTQVTPFDASEREGNVDYIVKDKHLREQPVPPAQINPAIPDYVERVILRCLAKKPDDRYATCAEVLAALSAANKNIPFSPGTPTVIEGFRQVATPVPPRPVIVSTRPMASPRRASAPVSQPVPVGAGQTVPARPVAGKTRLWAGAGLAVAVAALATGYFVVNRGSERANSASNREPQTRNAPVGEAPKSSQPLVSTPTRPPDGDGGVPTAPTTGPSGGTLPNHGPGDGAATNSPQPGPVPTPPGDNVDQLLSDGKQQLAGHDDAGARETFRKAAQQGNSSAMVLLGVMYQQGLGGPKNDADAVGMFQQASDLGYASGTYNLGLMYESGAGVPAGPGNQATAAALYQKALEQRGGNQNAAFRLGLMYELGRGVAKDPAKARKYYEISGTPEAKARLANLPPQ